MKENVKMEKNQTDNKSKLFSIRNIVILIITIIVIGFIISCVNKKSGFASIDLETHANEVSEWQYKIEDDSIVAFHNKNRTGDLEGKTMQGIIYERYTFKSLKPGKTTIKFTFINKNNKSFGEIKEYNVVVDKRLKITIKEK